MNSIRSPAPGATLFNLPKNNMKNSVFVNTANTIVSAVNTANTAVNTVVNSVVHTNTNAKTAVNMTHVVLFIFLFIVIILFGVFWRNVNESLYMFYEYIRQLFGAKKVPIKKDNPNNVTKAPKAPQDTPTNNKDIVEKILPGRKQVFNISKNNYSYYDAEPLCKALGADLATYEQVKEAYSHGADWCNYGWVKGQMAVYPTQKDTWDILQSGPEKDRMSCGRPGLNGGFFDNPELRYGVNCYGVKPDQKDHDATAVASGQGAPLSPGQLEQEKKVAKYRGETNYISVLPWSKNTWSA
jgi:hypothetical protein